MQRNLPPLPAWMTATAVILALGIIALLAFTLRRESAADLATERAHTSSLLPDNWSMYGADVWSVGYPNNWKIDSELLGTGGATTTHAIALHPEGSDTTDYVAVEKESRTLTDIEAAFVGVSGLARSEFRFAGYPAVKFSANGRDEYYISYNDDVYRITTDHPSLSEVSIMLATFRFE